jgi:hypothetical protein
VKTVNALVFMLILIPLSIFGVSAVLQFATKIGNTATVKTVGVGVFENVNCTVPLTSIDWGFLQPGQIANYSAYVLSESNVPITLSMYTADWNPANASEFIALTWNYAGKTISPHASVPVTFSLAVNASISGISTFSFDLWIVGSG